MITQTIPTRRYLNMREQLAHRTKLLLGCSDYLPHLLVSYLDIHPWCFFCGVRVTYDTATIEHLLPQSKYKGVLNKPKVLACYFCNGERANTDLEKYLVSPRLIVSKTMAGYHHYKHLPQNGFEYVGVRPPELLSTIERGGREFGLMT